MFTKLFDASGRAMAAAGVAAVLVAAGANGAMAQEVVSGESYVPSIWIDPDGCEHFVMDDGFEGYMTPHLKRNGLPVCGRTAPSLSCGTLGSDALFATDSYTVSAEGRDRVLQFFNDNPAKAYIIQGHTDARGSDAYNMTLSKNRANAVAAIAQSAGKTIQKVEGYGERKPRASNNTAAGMAENRRVEIVCVK
ncbi:OmpA family protein [Aliiroseovarius sp. PTFE2010]|uniref:OmpA family protein n=1 Tax=Aliiroseovarius sp. PTFE2010 TaxID=3417190 RepID=UPI003CF7C4BE